MGRVRLFTGPASRAALAAAAVLLVAVTPTGLAQIENPTASTPTTLYFHLFDTFNPFPINTQPMNAEFFEVGGTNFPTVRSQGYAFNTIYGRSTPGPVEYDFIENGRPRFHPESGIAADVKLDKNVQPVAYLYLEVRDLIGLEALPSGLPALHFKLTMREGDNLDAADSGAVIMSGAVAAHVMDVRACPQAFGSLTGDPLPDVEVPVCQSANAGLAGQTGPDGLPVLVPDESGIVEVVIPMALEKDVITKASAYNVRIDWWQDPAGAAGEGELATGFMRLVSDPEHLPRLEMAVLNPVYIEFIHPQVAAGTLLIHTAVNSPWGTYDVDVENMTVTVTGPSTPQTLERVVTQNAHVHHLHDEAAQVTYLWKFRDEGAKEGDYRITLSVPNLAGNAVATGTAGFKIEGKRAFGLSDQGEVVAPAATDEDTRDTPASPLALLLAALGAAAVLRRGWSA